MIIASNLLTYIMHLLLQQIQNGVVGLYFAAYKFGVVFCSIQVPHFNESFSGDQPCEYVLSLQHSETVSFSGLLGFWDFSIVRYSRD
jgi:hypothetical protein